MDADARELFLAFAKRAPWHGNFREFNKALRRMATLAGENPIGTTQVEEEIKRLREAWTHDESGDSAGIQRPLPAARPTVTPDTAEALLRPLLNEERLAALDRIEEITLAEVVRVCRRSRSLADAGRTLYNVSGKGKNPSDRLRKYLQRHQLDFHALREQPTEYPLRRIHFS
jgi:transcriptional regulatory protein RtcR